MTYMVKCYRPSTDSIVWLEVREHNECRAMAVAQEYLGVHWVACYCGEREPC